MAEPEIQQQVYALNWFCLQNRKLLIFHGLTVASLSCPF
jgi:hypothetical protein